MATVRITDAGGNKPTFVQWDVDRVLYISGVSSTPCLHFANAELKRAIVVEATDDNGRWKCLVPNFILQFACPMVVSVFVQPDEGCTVATAVYAVQPKLKPQDYSYTENIGYINWVAKSEEVQDLIDTIQGMLDRGELKGDPFTYEDFTPEQLAALKGDPGDDGVSPTVSTEITYYGNKVTFTDADGDHTINVLDGMTATVKSALLNLFQHVAYVDDQGQTYYDALYDAFNPVLNVDYITVVFDPGTAVIYNTYELAQLRPYITCTAHYDDGTSAEVDTYTLSGTLATGTDTITVTYGGKSAIFTVTVVEWLTSISAVFTQGSATIYTTDTLDTLKQYLTVTAAYFDGTSETVTTYTLSGSMDAGTQTITVAYGGKTTTFTVTVVEWLVSISAVFTQGQDTSKTIDSTRINAYIGTAGAWIASDDSYSMCVPVTVGKRYAIRFTSTDSTNVGSIFRFGFSDTNTPNGQTLSGWIRTTPQDCAFTEIIADKAYLVIQMGASVAAGSVSNGYLTLTELAEIVYSTDSLDSLRQYLTVTATYADDTTATVSDYTLAGTLSSGTSSVTVNYGGKTTTFNVTVTAWNINWDYTDGDPTEHGFYAFSPGTMLSNGYQLAGISGGRTIRHEPDMSYANGVAEIKFTVSVMASSYQGLCFFTPKMRLRIYNNKLYFVGDDSTTAAGQTQIASGLNTTDIYTMRWEWNAATGARVYLNGNLIHTYSAALTATTTRFMANATEDTTTVVLHSMRFREVS